MKRPRSQWNDDLWRCLIVAALLALVVLLPGCGKEPQAPGPPPEHAPAWITWAMDGKSPGQLRAGLLKTLEGRG